MFLKNTHPPHLMRISFISNPNSFKDIDPPDCNVTLNSFANQLQSRNIKFNKSLFSLNFLNRKSESASPTQTKSTSITNINHYDITFTEFNY